MRIFKTRRFAKKAASTGLTDTNLKLAVAEVQKGLVDANLGGSLVKKRVAIGGRGKSAGLRTILVYKASEENVFCIYVFAKSERANITQEELEALKQLGKEYLSMNAKQIELAIKENKLMEVE
jgi:hypothetical protein